MLRRWFVFAAAFALTLVPGAVLLIALPRLAEVPRLLELAWVWLLMALPTSGFVRIDFDGQVWLAGSSWLLALVFWACAGLAFAFALRRVRLAVCLLVSVPVVVATGLLANFLLSLIGLSSFTFA